jgi:iron complex transport system substrate-binding protein
MVEIAGAKNEISKTGEESRRLTFDEIKKSNPEIIIMMPCGFDVNRTISEYKSNLQNNSEWNNLEAVKENKVYVVDANSYFSKSSIRTITGLEILAKIFHPKIFTDLIIPENSFRLIKNV